MNLKIIRNSKGSFSCEFNKIQDPGWTPVCYGYPYENPFRSRRSLLTITPEVYRERSLLLTTEFSVLENKFDLKNVVPLDTISVHQVSLSKTTGTRKGVVLFSLSLGPSSERVSGMRKTEE